MPRPIAKSQRQNWNKFGLYISFPSIFMSLSFLDPINWPKNLVLALVAPIIFWTAMRNTKSKAIALFKLRTSRIFLITFVLTLVPAMFTFESLTRLLWGTWGRNNGLVTYVCLLIIAISVAAQARIPGFANHLLVWIQGFSLVAGLYGYMQIFGLDPVDWSSQNQVFSFFGNTNFASAIFAMGTIASILITVKEKQNQQKRTLGLASVALLGYLTFATGSLQGLVAIAIAVAIIVFIQISQTSRKFALGYSAVALASGVLIFSGFAGYGPLGDLIRQYTIALRFQYWMVGIEMGLKNPLFGVGVDSYGDFYREYRPIELIRQTTLDLTTNNAHNSVIQVFATFGLLGLIGLLVPLFFALKSGLSILLHNKVDEWSAIAILFFSLWSMSLISIDNIAIAIWNWVAMGALVGKYFSSRISFESSISEPAEKKRSTNSVFNVYEPQKVTALTLSAILLTFSWSQSQPERNLLRVKQIVIPEGDQNGPIVEKRKLFEGLRNSSSLTERHFFELGLEQNALGDWPYTIEAMKVGIKKYPKDFYIFDLLAVTQENNGLLSEAVATRISQLELDPNHAVVLLNLTKDLFKLGRTNEAKFYLDSMKRLKEFLSPEGIKDAEILAEALGTTF